MRTLQSTLPPEEFVSRLDRWRRVWRRNCRNLPPSAARRGVHELIRRRVRWYKRVAGVGVLPVASRPATSDPVWTDVAPKALKIVFVPASDASLPNASAARDERRRLRRMLRGAFNRDGTSFELLSSRRSRADDELAIGRAEIGSRTVFRGVVLDAIGGAIMPGLADDEVSALLEAGATVLENEIISIVDPVETGDAMAPSPDEFWHLSAVGADKAHERGLRGEGVLIGVLDTGIDSAHAEFKDKELYFRAFAPSGAARRLKRPKDYGGHGTHVAALCAGGSRGVAPRAGLAVAAVITEVENGRSVGYTTQILAGLNWLAIGGDGLDRPVDVINASIGGPDRSEKYYAAVADYHLRGALMVAAVGNGGRRGVDSHEAPGMFDCVVAVGAVDSQGVAADFSAWGPAYAFPDALEEFKPDIVAPGVGVNSAVPGNRYAEKSGTSMASPLVAGAAALLIQDDARLRGNPELLRQRLLSLATSIPEDRLPCDRRKVGRGSLDLSTLREGAAGQRG